MELTYFDSHCHPQLSAFDADRTDVLARMRQQGVGGLVVGTDVDTSRMAIELAREHDFLWAAVGVHPNDAPEKTLEGLSQLAADPKVVAIGECGLDYYRNSPSAQERERQRARFMEHLRLAKSVDKPLMIHCRPTQGTQNAHEEMLEILKGQDVPAAMHFFTSTPEVARQYLELGCYLSFPGVVTFTDMYDETVRVAPLERLLSETDAPFAAPVPFRGQRNEPAYVEKTVERLAGLKGVSTEEMAAQTVKNAARIFGLGR